MRMDGGMIRLKRVYDSPAEEDGFRVLVERLWPRGITKAEAHLVSPVIYTVSGFF